jgi:hypothetical protein
MFSQALMYYAFRHFENGWAGEPEIDPAFGDPTTASQEVGISPSECLQFAYRDLLADESVEAGEGFLVFLVGSAIHLSKAPAQASFLNKILKPIQNRAT